MVEIPQSVREVIESGALAHFVTLNKDGSPQVTCVWVGIQGDELVTAHLFEHQKVRNVRRDGRVALSMQASGTNQIGLQIWCMAEFARSAIVAADAGAREYEDGAWFPDHRPLTALRATLPQWFPRVNEIIQLIGAHNLLAVASSGMLADEKLQPLVDHYLRGAGEIGARERSRLFRLAWDFTGSALANRVELYERFYLASGGRNQQIAHQRADRAPGSRMVDAFLAD